MRNSSQKTRYQLADLMKLEEMTIHEFRRKAIRNQKLILSRLSNTAIVKDQQKSELARTLFRRFRPDPAEFANLPF